MKNVDEDGYEWKAMSEWLQENKELIPLGKNIEDDGWEFCWGALRRKVVISDKE